jgi:hypothetical protein
MINIGATVELSPQPQYDVGAAVQYCRPNLFDIYKRDFALDRAFLLPNPTLIKVGDTGFEPVTSTL